MRGGSLTDGREGKTRTRGAEVWGKQRRETEPEVTNLWSERRNGSERIDKRQFSDGTDGDRY
jgi:hypothetical protein